MHPARTRHEEMPVPTALLISSSRGRISDCFAAMIIFSKSIVAVADYISAFATEMIFDEVTYMIMSSEISFQLKILYHFHHQAHPHQCCSAVVIITKS
jgi:hypothetical protein